MQKLHRPPIEILARRDGQTMAEYSTVLSVITIAALAALALLSGSVSNALMRVAGYFT